MTYRKLFSLGMNGIFSFSSKPLILIGLVGVLISIGSLIVSAYSLYHKIRYGRTILGWDFGLSSIYFLSWNSNTVIKHNWKLYWKYF